MFRIRCAVPTLGVVLLASIFSATARGQGIPRAMTYEEAAKRIKRLPPSAFTEVPPNIRALMEAQGCRVPQDPFVSRPHNVVSGEFVKRGQRDWAAFCSSNGRTTLRMYFGGPARCPHLEYSGSDLDMLQDYEFYMHVTSASPKQLRAAVIQHGDPKFPQATHDAVDIGSEKASTAYYCHNGKWIGTSTGD